MKIILGLKLAINFMAFESLTDGNIKGAYNTCKVRRISNQ